MTSKIGTDASAADVNNSAIPPEKRPPWMSEKLWEEYQVEVAAEERTKELVVCYRAILADLNAARAYAGQPFDEACDREARRFSDMVRMAWPPDCADDDPQFYLESLTYSLMRLQGWRQAGTQWRRS